MDTGIKIPMFVPKWCRSCKKLTWHVIKLGQWRCSICGWPENG